MDCCETKSCVECSVKNCVYHAENNVCAAGHIKVGGATADKTQETCCDTFKAR